MTLVVFEVDGELVDRETFERELEARRREELEDAFAAVRLRERAQRSA